MTLNTPTQIDLAAGRRIVIRQRGHAYTFNLRRAEESNWLDYFDAIVVTSEQRAREVIRETDASAAALDLVEDLLVSVEGYALPAGMASFNEISDWKRKIPMAHRLSVAEILLDVAAIEEEDEAPLVLGSDVVILEAVWTADDEGRMHRVRTRHYFETPSQEHCRRYMKRSSQAKVVGGSRSGKTIFSGAQRVLCSIYDELVQRVDGYAAGAAPLSGNREIAQWMDARHKVAAAQKLFASIDAEE